MKSSQAPSTDRLSDRMSSAVASRPGNDGTPLALEYTSLGLIELASNPFLEGVLGPNKDGRVRNPVPSKLKGKTDNKKGNFGVMHLDMSPGKKTEAGGRDIAAERDAAARRTSENTASRAKAAQQEKYLPPRKRVEVHLSGASRSSPFGGREDQKQRARPLTPDETKYEQARLLTLLRSINPVTVVDQICKAVAYFGGIPGAPPPEDGIFPESVNTRETGALFIGWLSEIFPDLARSAEESAPLESLRSNSKKGNIRPSARTKETPNSTTGHGYGQTLPAPSWNLPQSLTLVNTQGPTSRAQTSPAPAVPPQITENPVQPFVHHPHQTSPTPTTKLQPAEVSPITDAINKRKRGRPKGSRNKGRNSGLRASDVAGGQDLDARMGQYIDGSRNQPGSQVVPDQATSSNAAEVSGTCAVATAPADPARPDDHTLDYHGVQFQDNATGQGIPVSHAAIADELSPEERAIVEAFRRDGPQTTGNLSTVSPVVVSKSPVQSIVQTGVKRKRAPLKPKANHPHLKEAPESGPQPAQDIASIPASSEGAISVAPDSLQWSPADATTAPPPAKKQRKPKPTGVSEYPSQQKGTSVVHQLTPPIAPSTHPDSNATSQQSVLSTRLPAEGLEAHYERFANLQQQTGRSSTPPVSAQSATRQHPKGSSGNQQVSQQPQALAVHTTQQAATHKEQTLTSSSRAPTTFYNQRSQSANFNQPYQVHQPSQYGSGHQVSPQLSNSNYRTTSSHTIQASPRFAQTDETFRTASPHTMTQSSPSYAPTDSAYRTPSSQTLVQSAPSYSRAEAPYRSSSAHSLVQTSTSYPPRPSQSQAPSTQPNEGHYGQFSDPPSYMDLPTLDSLGHASGQGPTNVSMSMNSSGSYGQGHSTMGSTRSGNGGGLYRTTPGLSNAFDTSANELLRNARSSNNSASYASTSAMRDFL